MPIELFPMPLIGLEDLHWASGMDTGPLSEEALAQLGAGPAKAADTGVQLQKAFLVTCDVFRRERPRLRLRDRSEVLMAGAEALFARYKWRPGLEAMKKRRQDWRDPRPPVRDVERNPEPEERDYGPEEITTVKLEGWFLDIIDAFKASHAAAGFHKRRGILEEGARTLMFDEKWLPDGALRKRRQTWRDPR